jgi:hypothetical protein
VLGQRVEKGVGGRVVAVPGESERTRDRREEHEGSEVEVPRQLVQVERRVHLRCQYPVEALRCQRHDVVAVEDTGRVHHCP